MNAEAPVGNNIGRVRHDFKFGLQQSLSVFNNYGEKVLQIRKTTKNYLFATNVDYTVSMLP